MVKENIEDYYNNRFRDHFNEWVKKTHAHEHPGEGTYIFISDLNEKSMSHIPKRDIPLFHCSLGWCVLIDQVMYTYFKKDYPKFQSLTLYPKIEAGPTCWNVPPKYIFRNYLNKDIVNFFLEDLKVFFKEFKFEEADWDSVTEKMVGDKDIMEGIKNVILEMRKE
jgi:hypothetical protein